MFVHKFKLRGTEKIIDVGGTPLNWSYIDVKPRVLLGNINETDRDEGSFSYRKLDGTKLPFKDKSFDIAFSNSVIEHVGGVAEQQVWILDSEDGRGEVL